MSKSSIGVRIRKAREDAGFTREQVATATGIHRNTIADCEADASTGVDKVARMLSLYRTRLPHLSCDEVLGLNPREFPSGKYLVDQAMHDRIMALPDEVNEAAGGRELLFAPPLISLATEIPEGAVVVDAETSHRMLCEAEAKLAQVAPKYVAARKRLIGE